MTGVILVNFAKTFADDLATTWNFSNANHYTLQDGLELNEQTVRMKAQRYAADEHTVALYHLDETTGDVAIDSSAFANAVDMIAGAFGAGKLDGAFSFNGARSLLRAADSASLSLGQTNTLEAWAKLAEPMAPGSTNQRQGIIDKGNYALYYDNETGKVVYELANNAPAAWSQAAGNDIQGSWDVNGKMMAASSVALGGKLYVGLGSQIGDAEVWVKDGATWAMIGGDGVNGSWADQTFETVRSITTDGTLIYAGLGDTAGDAEVWSWNGTTWAKIGGDAINNSWQLNTFEAVQALDYMDGILYAGLGNSASDAEVWSWNGTTWAKIGGDAINNGWGNGFETTGTLVNDGTHIYAGLGTTAGDAEVWSWNGTTWTQIGGDGVNNSWNTVYETVHALHWRNNALYAGLGDTAGDAEVWRWNGTTWTQIGGGGLHGSWSAEYEYVRAFAQDDSYLYAGLGSGKGDGEVYRYNGVAWEKIGGDDVNGGWSTARGDIVRSMTLIGGRLYVSLYDSAGGSYVYSWDGDTWTIEGGEFINESWGYYGLGSIETLFAARGKLYAGMGASIGSAQVWEYDGNTSNWRLVGGQGIRGSWAPDQYELVSAMHSYGGNLVVGLGRTNSEGEVWTYNGTTWTKIGGEGLNGSWGAGFEEVTSLASYGGYLYAGLGVSANDAEVWRWNGTTWTKIGGDSLHGGWTTNFERVMALTIYDGQLHAGLGTSANDAEVWRWNGTTWTKIGGDGVNSSWADSIEQVESMIAYNGKLYAGLGTSAGDGDLWEWNGTTWTKIGGDGVNSSWDGGTYEVVRSLTVYNGDLYAGLGSSAGDGELWRWDGTDWEKVAGNFVNNSWGNTMEEVEALSVYRGKLYAGTGNSANADAAVWAYGNNGYLASQATGFNTDWRHVAGTYDGTTMRLFIDGVQQGENTIALSLVDTSHELLVGSTYGAVEQGAAQGYFNGLLDEVRISSVARTEFTTKPYSTGPQLLTLATAVLTEGVKEYTSFAATEYPDGGNITYRLSNNNGETWQYWNGSTWLTSESASQSNTATEVDDKISEFPVTFYGIKWQAVLTSDGEQRPVLSSVTVWSDVDLTAPETNASDIVGFRSAGGQPLNENSWTNGASPAFSWTAAADEGAGIKGYCAYFGTDQTADPVTTAGLLGASPEFTGGKCQFLVPDAALDLGAPGYLGAAMTTNTAPYYLVLKAIDAAGNISPAVETFALRFDNTPPNNPGYITAPSGFINTKATTLTWPISGGQAASDTASGVAGLQYRINDSAWYGDSHSGTGDITDLLVGDGNYETQEVPDFANIHDGVNTIYFRTWDIAGNVTTNYATAVLRINTAGSPSEPQNLQVTPATNTTNSFAFSWSPPASFVGNANTLTYCYAVNVLPSSTTCTFTSSGVTSLSAGAYATQPGANTLYLVARDESSNINYASYANVTFTANTTAPGIPTDLDIVDASIKATSRWRGALTWEEPNQGNVSAYRVYRSTDNASFSLVGTSSSTTYIDGNLLQRLYYYRVTACDNTNNCGAYSATVSLLPTGKFTTPAEMISDPQVSNVTTKKATITWATDRTSDSRVAIGTVSGQYGTSEIGNSDQVTLHTIELDNLAAGTTYYYIAKWTDEDGNTGLSQEYTFSTAPAPVVSNIETLNVGLSGASIGFTSKGAFKVNLYYGQSDGFGGLRSINTSSRESEYTFAIDGLADGARYFYRLSAFDSEGGEYMGNTFTFNTPPRPRINNLRFQPVEGEPTSTQMVTWQTNVPSTSTVLFGKVGTGGTELHDSALKTEHEIRISNLEDDSLYFILAQGRDQDGNIAVSDRQQFRTALDTRPPRVYDVNVESSIRGTGAEARGQVIVSWRTDEPAMSQAGYSEGSNASTFNNRTAEDSTLKTQHLVIVSDLPTSKVYSIQPISKDRAGNLGTGETQSAIIGRASESVLTVILNTLQRVFGL